MATIAFVDSHTEGEPTRVFLDDGGSGLFGQGESAAALARRWRAAVGASRARRRAAGSRRDGRGDPLPA
jgi:hypothetical protein